VAGDHFEARGVAEEVGQSGIFSFNTVMLMAAFCFVLAVICGVPLVLHGGLPILVIGLLSVLFGYIYTAGPYPLAYLGLGDLFVILFFGLVAVGGVVFLQVGRWLEEALVLGLQIGLHATVLIAINNLRDMEGDIKVGKYTLPVRFGKRFARSEILALCFLPFFINIYWFSKGYYWAAGLPFLCLPLAARISFLVFNFEPSLIYNDFLAKGAGLHLLFGLLLAVGFVV
jgi:1,4-dihydroxy-2-naphthoate octaprenyltransferase